MLVVTSLASGSSGNALVLRSDRGALLIDCGVSQRMIERSLAHAGLTPHDLHAIVLTHEHGDHVGCAGAFARRHNIPVAANSATAAALRSELVGVYQLDLPTGRESSIGPFDLSTFPVPHDAADPVGVVVHIGGCTIAVATDLGSWNPGVAAALARADLIVLEANHDREKLRLAPYTWPIKQRIAGERGHLDNVDAGRLLTSIGADGRRRTAWLAHLSQQANSPEIALRVICIELAALPRRAPLTWESDRRAEQLSLL
jgi:phosphoribosyl 1,2-cyclic phosphodiesterase